MESTNSKINEKYKENQTELIDLFKGIKSNFILSKIFNIIKKKKYLKW